jgi:hypothetical protein
MLTTQWWIVLGAATLVAACSNAPMTPAGADKPLATTAPVKTYPPLPFDGGSITWPNPSQACTLQISGQLHDGTLQRARQAAQLVEAAKCPTPVVRLKLTQARLGDAITLGAVLKNRNFATELVAGSTCDTLCLLVFSAGRERWLPAQNTAARLLVTQVPPDADFGHQVCESEWSAGQRTTLTRYLRAMLPPATAADMLQKMQAATCSTSETIPPQQAVAGGLATGVR